MNEAALDGVTGTWYSADGEVVTRSAAAFEVHGLRGHPHCGWQSVVFLALLWPMGRELETGEAFDAGDTRQYIRDSANKLDLDDGALAGELDLSAEMPPGAMETGYYTESAELWLGPDGGDRYAYLVFDSHTERWPRAREPFACE